VPSRTANKFSLSVTLTVFPSEDKNYFSWVISVIDTKKAGVICPMENFFRKYNFQTVFWIVLSTQNVSLVFTQWSLNITLCWHSGYHVMSFCASVWQFSLRIACTGTDTCSLALFLQVSSCTSTAVPTRCGTQLWTLY
jgi:hypothetical protein